ncbi:probable isoaspartyl peptidase/L-asparaginase GA20639 isoform X1 [Bactrocera neohumeralis]|uniref:probable isoaspartyl peptidase/L-asparaginase GA20639 isoform X1 n=1 Tax=Bactrocera neohumeralis TaxID=98809 RepID=UPI00216649B1|nr:probable isoaspartyl peptidase/L-asparaginase GA20639 isoform X1 [Bactrocera neohumeralis]
MRVSTRAKVFFHILIWCFSMALSAEPIVLVHGGAGSITDAQLPVALHGVKTAARVGFETLKCGGSVLDAVQQAVRSMEINPQFNAGYGSVLTWEGKVEMDAAIMNGEDLNAGCVSVVRDIYHPVDLARRVMEKTRHMFLSGEGAMLFAEEENFEILPEGALVTNKSQKALEDYKNSLNATTKKLCNTDLNIGCPCDVQGVLSYSVLKNFLKEYGSQGTVGAVAIDELGNLAAATSTGGITGKMPGRVGDSPLLGAGTYADNEVAAISATGHGETIMRYNVASRILAHIKYENMTAEEASAKVLKDMTQRFEQGAGIISIDKAGNVGINFTTARMTWAYQRGEELHYGADPNEDKVDIVGEPRLSAMDLCV